jgi:predicted MFS family arabinose efflux permease
MGMLLCFLGGAATLLASGFLLLLVSRFVVGLGHLTTSYLALLLGMFFRHVHGPSLSYQL